MASTLNKLNRRDAQFWQKAFVATEVPALLKVGVKVNPPGLAHLAAEYADAAVREYNRRTKS